MLYIKPDYYSQFVCVADQCEDTCCAGWEIVIDKGSLKKYKKVKGKFSVRLRSSIRWWRKSFCQTNEKRCAFLNDRNLCDMYTELGKESLCRTCRLYPRHIEEFENVREITLSASCPQVARILLGYKEPVRFYETEKEGEEEYENFDVFLYSKLTDARQVMIEMLQNREISIGVRFAMILGLSHDMQKEIQQGKLFSCDDLFAYYKKPQAESFFERKYKAYGKNKEKQFHLSKKAFTMLYGLERLREEWEWHLLETEYILFAKGENRYRTMHLEFALWVDKNRQHWNIQWEQLCVYFIFTYFCGAVYDGRIYAKVKMAVVSCLVLYDMMMARWVKNEKTLDDDDVVELVYRYCREVEHSDVNLEKMDKALDAGKEKYV